MYLISIYFDEKTNYKIEQLIRKVAEKSGNTFMLDGKVPPHITISAFETKREKEVIAKLEAYVNSAGQGDLHWVSIGTFLPHVIYAAPVLNQYLHTMAEDIFNSLNEIEDTVISKYYRPFQWIPHTTIAKTLDRDEMKAAFEAVQEQFSIFHGTVTKIGLAKTNPYEELVSFTLKENGYINTTKKEK